MKNIGIVPNTDRDTNLSYTKEICTWLIERGCQPYLSEHLGDALNMRRFAHDEEAVYRESDFLVVLGGDGTILSAARRAALFDRPLMGINLGTLGYLTDVDRSDGFTALSKALDGKYKIEKRMMLQVADKALCDKAEPLLALNDVCVVRGVFSTMINLALYINDEFIDTFKADGIIIATPTGSTAYNMSAGGPILKPDGEMIAITPICPHTLYTRPWIISADDLVRLEVMDQSDGNILALDGQSRWTLKKSEIITVGRSNYYTRIIRTSDHGFYEILRRKLVKS